MFSASTTCDAFSTQDDWRLKSPERAALARNSWFTRLSPAIRHDLLRSVRVRSFLPGETVFSSGEPRQSWKVCLAGAVRLTIDSAGGKTLALGVIRPGQWFGDLPLDAADAAHTHEATAHRMARVGEVSRHEIGVLVATHPEFHAALFQWQSMRLASVFQLLEDHVNLTARSRLARQLLRLAKDHGVPLGHDGVRIDLSFLQAELAALVGCSRQRLNSEISAFRRQGLVTQESGKLVVMNRGALQLLAE